MFRILSKIPVEFIWTCQKHATYEITMKTSIWISQEEFHKNFASSLPSEVRLLSPEESIKSLKRPTLQKLTKDHERNAPMSYTEFRNESGKDPGRIYYPGPSIFDRKVEIYEAILSQICNRYCVEFS